MNFLPFTMLSRSSALPTALTITVLGMSTWKRVAVAVLAAQHVGARADLHEEALVARRHLHDGHRRGGADLAHQDGGAVLLEHALGLGGGRGRVDRVFRDDVELAPHDAAGLVDLLLGHAEAELGVGAERAEEAGQRRQMPDLDLVGLAARNGWKPERVGARYRGTAFQYRPPAICLSWLVSSDVLLGLFWLGSSSQEETGLRRPRASEHGCADPSSGWQWSQDPPLGIVAGVRLNRC